MQPKIPDMTDRVDYAAPPTEKHGHSADKYAVLALALFGMVSSGL
jgi:hypothetical protein